MDKQMKNIKKLFIIPLLFLALTGCSKKDAIQFCEGVDVEGKGVNCGKKFSTGDLTGVIRQSKPFETEMIDVKIVRIEKSSKIVEKTVHVKVERDKNTASTPLSFYNGGNYVVEIYRENDKIGESSIEVSDVY